MTNEEKLKKYESQATIYGEVCIEGMNQLLESFKDEVKDDAIFLDIGSGLGVFPYEINKLGWDCTAIDPDKTACHHIQKKLGIKTREDWEKAHKAGKIPENLPRYLHSIYSFVEVYSFSYSHYINHVFS